MALSIERVVGVGELCLQPLTWQEIYLKASRDVNNASDLTQGQKDAAIGVLDRMGCRLTGITVSEETNFSYAARLVGNRPHDAVLNADGVVIGTIQTRHYKNRPTQVYSVASNGRGVIGHNVAFRDNQILECSSCALLAIAARP